MDSDSMVYLVDDDAVIRQSLAWVFDAAALPLTAYESADAFIEDTKPNLPGCLILDLHLPKKTGLEALEGMRRNLDFKMPVIIVTGTGDIPAAVRSMKLGVIEFLEKPADPRILVPLVRQAIAEDKQRRAEDSEHEALIERLAELTPRERELLSLVCQGFSNKQIAYKLGISFKTVANHREHVMKKTKALNTADLVRLTTVATAA
jgi:two-component system, LuxR family, response regulator FixJ